MSFFDFLICVGNSEKTIENKLDYEKIVYIPHGKNKGLAKALNNACRTASNKGTSISITFDQDIFLKQIVFKN